MIHSTAIISKQSKIAPDATIGPYAIIEDNVTIDSGCSIAAHAIIKKGTHLKDNVTVESFAIIGGHPQDRKFDLSISTQVEIGRDTEIREGVTIHRSTDPKKPTLIGDNCMIMGYVHIGHDSTLGNNVTVANQTLISGCVEIQSHAFISGGVAIHQFMRIGENCMIGGHATMVYDIAPFLLGGKRNVLGGLNLIGLKRRGFSKEIISDIKECYKIIYLSKGVFEKRLQNAFSNHQPQTEQGRQFLDFFRKKPYKGFMQPELVARK